MVKREKKLAKSLTSKHEMYREEIMEWVVYHYFYSKPRYHETWIADGIVKLPPTRATKYLLERLLTTRDEGEYYQAMIFPYKAVPDSELFEPFPIWRFLDSGGTDIRGKSLCEKWSRAGTSRGELTPVDTRQDEIMVEEV